MKKISKYLASLLPFAGIMIIFFLVEYLIFFGLIFTGMIIGADDPVMFAYHFFNGNLNLISALMYTAGLIPAVLFYYHLFYKKGKPLSENRHLRPSSFLYTLLLTWGMSHAVSLLLYFLAFAMPRQMQDYASMMDGSGISQYSVLWVISTLVLPPLVEETIFRGLTLRLLRRAGAPFFVANIIQAVLFGFFHMNLIQGIYAFCLGLVLGFLANHYRSLTLAMVFHCAFNFIGTVGSDLENRYLPEGFWFILILFGLVAMIAAYTLIRRERPRPRQKGVLLQNPYDDIDAPFI